MDSSVRALETIFLAYNLSIDWREEFDIRYNSKVEQTRQKVCMRFGNGPPLVMHS